MVVNDQAPSRRQASFIEQVVAIGKGTHLEAFTLHHVSEGNPHSLVIINDEDDFFGNRHRRLSQQQIAFLDGNSFFKSRKFGDRFDLWQGRPMREKGFKLRLRKITAVRLPGPHADEGSGSI